MVTGQGIDNNGGYWYLMSPDGTPIVPSRRSQPSDPGAVHDVLPDDHTAENSLSRRRLLTGW